MLFHRAAFLSHTQVNAVLGVTLLVALVSGLASWALPDGTSALATSVHTWSGVALVLALPSKLAGPVRSGMRRRSPVRWISVVFGLITAATVAFGVMHASGIAHGVGYWSPLWTHQLLGFLLIPLCVIHVVTRPKRRRRHDLTRRALLRYSSLGVAAAAVATVQRSVIPPLVGAPRRRSTGSYEIASFDPANLPKVTWFNDRRPDDTSADNWELHVQGEPMTIARLWELSTPVDAILDCTGGWWSEQRWDAVPLSAVVSEPTGRSVMVTSTTGYARWFALDELDDVYLAVGYGGQPLRAGHGAPVRLVVPGRRGPEWIKWVVEVNNSRRPSWASFPLPLS